MGVHRPLCGHPRSDCAQQVFVVPKGHPFTIVPDSSPPLPRRTEPRHAPEPRSVVAVQSEVLSVLLESGFPQVQPPVVCRVSVLVVNVVFRPLSSHVQPRQPLRKVKVVVDRKAHVPFVRRSWCHHVPRPSRRAGAQYSREDSGFGVVVKHLLEAFLSQSRSVVWFSHVDSLTLLRRLFNPLVDFFGQKISHLGGWLKLVVNRARRRTAS